MSTSNIRTLIGLVVITALGWQVWSLVTRPLNQRLQGAYLDRAQQAVTGGDITQARQLLAEANAIRPSDQVQNLSETIDQIAADPYKERSYMTAHGNEARATLLDSVIKDYDTPKAALEAAAKLYAAHEPRLADILLHKATAMDPNYSGVTMMHDYVETIGS